jgi:hypothetical protein
MTMEPILMAGQWVIIVHNSHWRGTGGLQIPRTRKLAALVQRMRRRLPHEPFGKAQKLAAIVAFVPLDALAQKCRIREAAQVELLVDDLAKMLSGSPTTLNCAGLIGMLKWAGR